MYGSQPDVPDALAVRSGFLRGRRLVPADAIGEIDQGTRVIGLARHARVDPQVPLGAAHAAQIAKSGSPAWPSPPVACALVAVAQATTIARVTLPQMERGATVVFVGRGDVGAAGAVAGTVACETLRIRGRASAQRRAYDVGSSHVARSARAAGAARSRAALSHLREADSLRELVSGVWASSDTTRRPTGCSATFERSTNRTASSLSAVLEQRLALYPVSRFKSHRSGRIPGSSSRKEV